MVRPRKTATTKDFLHLGEAAIEYAVVRSSRRTRTIGLHVDGGALRVLAPMRTTRAEIEALLVRRVDWIASRLAAQPAETATSLLSPGRSLPYRGAELALSVVRERARSGRVESIVGGLVVTLPSGIAADDVEAKLRSALVSWYRRQAQQLVGQAVERWSAAMGLVPKVAAVRDQKRRWGSCSPDGTLRFNWRLAMFAPAVLEYVVVHELAHLRHKNHGPAFWAEVERWLPEWKTQRAELRGIGALPL
jgi:predicted metal-dependent hydrolase